MFKTYDTIMHKIIQLHNLSHGMIGAYDTLLYDPF